MTLIENKESKFIADYNAYLQLKSLQYTNTDIAKHLSYTIEDLGYLISRYTFKNNIEYKLQEEEGSYLFDGLFVITKGINEILTKEEILEIYTFTRELVKQHEGIDYLQVFYHIESDSELLFINQVSDLKANTPRDAFNVRSCTLMFAYEY